MKIKPFTKLIAIVSALAFPASPTLAQMNPYLGSVHWVAFAKCPHGFSLADGSTLSIANFAALYSVMGLTYGGSQGEGEFALPDLRGRSAINSGAANGLIRFLPGQKVGVETVTLQEENLALHGHTVSIFAGLAPTTQSPVSASLAGANFYSAFGSHDVSLKAGSVVAESVGNSDAISIRTPYLALTPCVAITGVYPPQP